MTPLPEVTWPPLQPCRTCRGTGNSDRYGPEPIWVEGIKLQPNNLTILYKEPDLKVKAIDGKLYFLTSEGSAGLILGMQ